MNIKDYRLTGQAVKLSDWNPKDHADISREDAEAETEKLLAKMSEFQQRLYSSCEQSLLIVLQARDAAGKDGTIRKVMDGFNPLGVVATAYKAPNEVESGHDFLWRIHQHVPRKGHIAIFNRSHYEDILYPTVYATLPPAMVDRRYHHIKHFEALLHDANTTQVKFYLHISKEEQKKRLLERLETPEKQWKFDPHDLEDRAHWAKYDDVYSQILERTATEHAPWYIIPADRKWFRNYLIAKILLHTLEEMDLDYPKPIKNIQQYHDFE